jgi:hypothetical protein
VKEIVVKKILICTILISVFISSCSQGEVSESDIQTAIALTQAVITNTITPLPISTSTFTPTLAPTDTPTQTSTPTKTPKNTPTLTPTPDLRVIDGDPMDFLLQKIDLPPEAKYYLPDSSWISPHRNSEIISAWGVEEGRKYLEETGRIDGWWVIYLRGTITVTAPEQIYDNVVKYATAEGAQLVVKKYGDRRVEEQDFTEVDPIEIIGDVIRTYIKKEM